MKMKLQIKREQANLTIEQLALKASKKVDCGSASHLELVIKSIETLGGKINEILRNERPLFCTNRC